jgi:GNAT superfamily N-acetyltransferase
MSAVSVRPAAPADAEGVAIVHTRSWQAAYRGKLPQEYLDNIDPERRAAGWRRIITEADLSRGGLLVAVAEGDDVAGAGVGGAGVAGFSYFGPARDSDLDSRVTGEVFAIYAAPGAWGTGAGRALMAGAVAELARLGYADAILWVLDSNDRARRFYTLAGWAEDGAVKTDSRLGFDMVELRYRRTL